MNLLRTGAEFLERIRDGFLTETVTYQRGVITAEVKATPGKTKFNVDEGDGIVISAQMVDFLILKTNLTAFGSPQSGDKIILGSKTYEVLALAGEYYVDSDSYDLTWRIHTKEI